MKDRKDYLLAFDVILMYYNDIINYKLNRDIINFSDYLLDNTNNFIEKITVQNILKKMDIVFELKKTIVNNVNLNLLLDKLIISFKKVDTYEIY